MFEEGEPIGRGFGQQEHTILRVFARANTFDPHNTFHPTFASPVALSSALTKAPFEQFFGILKLICWPLRVCPWICMVQGSQGQLTATVTNSSSTNVYVVTLFLTQHFWRVGVPFPDVPGYPFPDVPGCQFPSK